MRRDKERIEPMLKIIKEVWEANPDMRLMQLICNVLPPGDNYFVDDQRLKHELKSFYKV